MAQTKPFAGVAQETTQQANGTILGRIGDLLAGIVGVNLRQVGGRDVVPGSATSASSVPVALATDVSGRVTLHDMDSGTSSRTTWEGSVQNAGMTRVVGGELSYPPSTTDWSYSTLIDPGTSNSGSSMDGTSNFLISTNKATFSGEEMVFSAILKTDSTGGTVFFGAYIGSAGTGGYSFGIATPSSTPITCYAGDDSASEIAGDSDAVSDRLPSDFTPTSYHHYQIRYGSRKALFYIDGILVASYAKSEAMMAYSTNDFYASAQVYTGNTLMTLASMAIYRVGTPNLSYDGKVRVVSDPLNLTYGTPSQVTVTNVAGYLVSFSSGYREVTIFVDPAAVAGIYVNANGTATSSHFLIPPGGSKIMTTAQAISAIRAGASNVIVYVETAT